MIVLDEQLNDPPLGEAIRKWYRGNVTVITELRAGTTIKDDDVPALLRTVADPTFVTVNVADFWRQLAPDRHFSVIGFTLEQREIARVSGLLRTLLSIDGFRTKRQRMGKIARVSGRVIQYYDGESWAVREIAWRD
jgi:hypothetical protein